MDCFRGKYYAVTASRRSSVLYHNLPSQEMLRSSSGPLSLPQTPRKEPPQLHDQALGGAAASVSTDPLLFQAVSTESLPLTLFISTQPPVSAQLLPSHSQATQPSAPPPSKVHLLPLLGHPTSQPSLRRETKPAHEENQIREDSPEIIATQLREMGFPESLIRHAVQRDTLNRALDWLSRQSETQSAPTYTANPSSPFRPPGASLSTGPLSSNPNGNATSSSPSVAAHPFSPILASTATAATTTSKKKHAARSSRGSLLHKVGSYITSVSKKTFDPFPFYGEWEPSPSLFPGKVRKGEFPLHQAAALGDVQLLQRIVKANEPIEEASYGYRPLHFAAFHGKTEAVRFLCSMDANLEARTDDGRSCNAVHLATHTRHADTLRELHNLSTILCCRCRGSDCTAYYCPAGRQ